MPVAGQQVIERLEVDPFDGTTVAAISLRKPDGTTTAPGATTSDGGNNWGAPVDYTVAGVWYRRWVVTGTGAGATEWQPVYVGPDGAPPAGRFSYATSTDYVNHTGQTPTADLDRQLAAASAVVDRLVACAIYPVDSGGKPTRTADQVTLREATCELVRWWGETGDETGVMATSGARIGSVAVDKATGGAGAVQGRRVGPEVLAILWRGGMLAKPPTVVG